MSHMDFSQGVREALQDQVQAARFYLALAGMAPNAAFRARIRCFAAEEFRHARLLCRLLPEVPGTMGPGEWQDLVSQGDLLEMSWSPGFPQPPMPPGHPPQPSPYPPIPEPTVPGSFAEGVARAIEGEVEAVEEYSELAVLAPNPDAREVMLCIQKDEMYHLVSFEFMYSIMRS